jgi:RimJ/RimL family protein N-acetyltransferase
MITVPLGPEVDSWPRPLPIREKITGTRVVLEPLHRRHGAELFEAAKDAPESFAYLSSYGPFSTRPALDSFISRHCATPEAAFWAIRPIATGRASGWLSLSNIEPQNAAIELGSIWFGPALQRTRAATEAMFLLLRHAADDLGYRRLVWQCNALNAPSRRAAERLGFTYEGTLRAHRVAKGRSRDTAFFSITAEEWPSRRDAILAWLAPENFDAAGNAIRPLASFR